LGVVQPREVRGAVDRVEEPGHGSRSVAARWRR
jgi:hypothetical protein